MNRAWVRPERVGEESGQALIIVAVMLLTLMIVAALVVDGSNSFVHRQSLQNAVDASALAAAQDLDPATGCAVATCATKGGHYAYENGGLDTDAPLPACTGTPGQTSFNCYVWPYKGDDTEIEVFLQKTYSNFFTGIFGLQTTVTTHAIASFSGNGTPPNISFAALDTAGAPNHTLLIESSGHLTVNNAMYINSANNGDAFDMKNGSTGSIFDPKGIYVTGGWESSGGTVSGSSDGTSCPILAPGQTVHVNANSPPAGYASDVPACPYINQTSASNGAAVVDPFAGKLKTPTLNPTGATEPGTKTYSTSSFSPVQYLDGSLDNSSTSFTAGNPSGLAITAGSTIKIDNEIMSVIGVGTASNGEATINVVRDPTSPAAHTEQSFSITKAVRSGTTMTLTTSSQTIAAGNKVWIHGVDPSLDGIYTVLAAPAPTSTSFAVTTGSAPTSYTVTNYQLTGNNTATLTTSAANNFAVGQTVTVANVVAAGNPVFNGSVVVTAVPTTTTFQYSLPRPSFNLTVTAASLLHGTATLTVGSLGSGTSTLVPGDTVTISGVDALLDGTFVVTGVNYAAKTFTYSDPGQTTTYTVTQEALSGGTATLTANNGLQTGDSVTVNVNNSQYNGTFNVTSANGTSFQYAIPGTSANITSESMTSGIATINAVNSFSNGQSLTISTGNPNYDGTYTISNVTGTSFRITPAVALALSGNKAANNGKITVTTTAANDFHANDVVAVAAGGLAYDNAAASLTNVGPGNSISYNSPTFNSTAWSVVVSGPNHVATLTTASPNGLATGSQVKVTGFTGALTCLNGTGPNTTVMVSAVTSTTFSYNANTCAAGSGSASGTLSLFMAGNSAASGTVTGVTLASTNNTGTASLSLGPTTCTPCGTATGPGYVSKSGLSVQISTTGNVVSTTTPTGTAVFTSEPVSDGVANGPLIEVKQATDVSPGSPANPQPYEISSGSPAPLSPGTYYGGICIGAASGSDCTFNNCNAGAYTQTQVETLSKAMAISDTTLQFQGPTNPLANGDLIQIDSEQMVVGTPITSSGPGPTWTVPVSRGANGTAPAAHAIGPGNGAIYKLTANSTASVTLLPGNYIMAGGGFAVCGGSSLSTPNGVMIYNTNDPSGTGTYANIGQVNLNTTGSVSLTPQTSGTYAGMTVFEDPTMSFSTDNCNGKGNPPKPSEWEIALQSMASTGANGELGSVSGTFYAPFGTSDFGDAVSGTANLAVITGCIVIDNSTATFNFNPSNGGLFGVASSLTG